MKERFFVLVALRFDEGANPRREDLRTESLGVLANAFRIELEAFEPVDRLAQRLRRLRVEEYARFALDHGFEGAARGIGNHGPAAGLCLDGCETEVFLPREHECPTAGVVIAYDAIGLVAQELDVRCRDLLQAGESLPLPDHHQAAIRVRERRNDDVDSLGVDQTRHHQIEILWGVPLG